MIESSEVRQAFMRISRRTIAALLASLALATACCREQPPNNQQVHLARERELGKRGGSIVYRLPSPPRTFNPLMAADEASLVASFFLLSGRLIDFDHDSQSYVPGLAEGWVVSEDGRAVEMILREGLMFSDGQPITADDVIFTLRAIYDERTGSPILADAMKVSGKQIEVTASGDRKLRFVFPDQVAAPESLISNLPVMPRHALEESLGRGNLGEMWGVATDPKGIIGCGPFVLESSSPGERATFRRNSNYWKKDPHGDALPYLDSITLEVVSDMNNAVQRLGQASIDIIDRLRAADYAALRSSSDNARAYDLGPGLSTDHFWFNLNEGKRDQKSQRAAKRAWFSDARFRRAVSHAVDRDSIASSILQGLATPLYGFISPANRNWASELPRVEYDLERARALLREAGFITRGTGENPELYDAGGNRVEWTIIAPVENEPRKLMAALIQEDLAKLGMKVHVAPIEFQALTERWSKTYDYDAILLGLSVTDTEPSSYNNFLRSDSAAHQWHPKQPKPATEWEARIDELVAGQAREKDAGRRREMVYEIQTILAERSPIIPIVARHILVAANARLGNYRPSNILPFSLWNADEIFVKD
jgi:peptide/nickel transport system substrate-binding protein